MTNFFFTLKFKITVALLLLVVSMTVTIVVSQYSLEEQLQSEKIIQLGTQLQHSAQQLSMQAMNYIANTPNDSGAYERDLNLYYKDLMSHVETFDMIADAFMSNNFSQKVTGIADFHNAHLRQEVDAAVKKVYKVWLQWRKKLMRHLGPSFTMPRLEGAAKYINEHSIELTQASDYLIEELTRQAERQRRQLQQVHQFFLLLMVLTTMGIILWFFQRVIKPLTQTSEVMAKTALGDFNYQLPVNSRDEIGLMNRQFNHLTQQLHFLFQLITRLQEGSNLDEILCFISEEFSRFLPLDWVGILFATGDNKIQLERGYGSQGAESFGSIRFALKGTLLEESMLSQQPLHIPNITERLVENKIYRFLNILNEKGCKEAIFMPLDQQASLKGVLVFASSQAHAYTQEHLALLKNITLLITLSFNRTVKLAEYQHLAVIGQFATGIAHEIRSPLATIGMALDYFKQLDLPENALKRATLAAAEAERMQGLMEDILLYSKPLVLETSAVDCHALLDEVRELQQPALQEKNLHLEILAPENLPTVEADSDRLKQVMLNLIQNAIQASVLGGVIVCTFSYDPVSHWVTLSMQNQGEIIPDALQSRLFEPFFTTRAHGTGLGLNIVKRIIEAHGGKIDVVSSEHEGTTISLHLPPSS